MGRRITTMPRVAEAPELERIEMDMLVSAINDRYGHDLSVFRETCLLARVRRAANELGFENLSLLLAHLLYDERLFRQFLRAFGDTREPLFSEPAFFLALRKSVMPVLRTYPSLRIWNAACGRGVDAYALMALLDEEGLSNRTTIYATDMSEDAVQEAAGGRVSIGDTSVSRFRNTGANRPLTDFFTRRGKWLRLRPRLLQRIYFTTHNPVTDDGFNEFHLIVARNSLAVYNEPMQARLHRIFTESLSPLGFLCLGEGPHEGRCRSDGRFVRAAAQAAIYRKVSF